MEISTHVWNTATRQCRFCLCLQGGSVFADFNTDPEGRVYLVRISFDGYGCCVPQHRLPPLPLDESATFVNCVEADDVNRDEMREILYRYFDQNQDVIWSDALVEHELLKR